MLGTRLSQDSCQSFITFSSHTLPSSPGFVPKLSGPLALLHGIAVLHKVYLAYILLFILRDFCIVCTTMYTIDFLLLIVALYSWRRFKSQSKTKRE